ncbi:methyl-CpG-binding domain protein 1a [Aplochiton taeniatus]
MAVGQSPQNMELQRKLDGPKKRIQACRECAACLREDCGKCDHCLDKPKFGGQNKKKQKCRFRRCKFRPELKQYSWRSWKGKMDVDSTEPPAHRRRRRLQRWTDLSDDTSEEDEEIRPGKELETTADSREWDVDDDDEVWAPELNSEEKEAECSDVLGTDPGMNVSFISQPSPPPLYPSVKISDMQRFVDIEVDLEFESDYDSPTEFPEPVRLKETGKDTPVVQSDGTPEDVSDDPSAEIPVVSCSVKYTLSLANEGNHKDVGERDLLRLLRGLRRTVLPAHWVGVLAAGPLLQLLQCSKLSPMTDTVIQIHPGFHYQITVQGLQLIPTHTLYNTNLSRFTNLNQVVSLLLDLETMAVCHGFSVHPSTQQNQSKATLVGRAAFCQLLIPHTQERCELCQEELSEEEME